MPDSRASIFIKNRISETYLKNKFQEPEEFKRELVNNLETSPQGRSKGNGVSKHFTLLIPYPEASPLRSKQGCGFGFIVRRSKGLMLSALTLVEIMVIPYLTFALTIKIFSRGLLA